MSTGIGIALKLIPVARPLEFPNFSIGHKKTSASTLTYASYATVESTLSSTATSIHSIWFPFNALLQCNLSNVMMLRTIDSRCAANMLQVAKRLLPSVPIHRHGHLNLPIRSSSSAAHIPASEQWTDRQRETRAPTNGNLRDQPPAIPSKTGESESPPVGVTQARIVYDACIAHQVFDGVARGVRKSAKAGTTFPNVNRQWIRSAFNTTPGLQPDDWTARGIETNLATQIARAMWCSEVFLMEGAREVALGSEEGWKAAWECFKNVRVPLGEWRRASESARRDPAIRSAWMMAMEGEARTPVDDASFELLRMEKSLLGAGNERTPRKMFRQKLTNTENVSWEEDEQKTLRKRLRARRQLEQREDEQDGLRSKRRPLVGGKAKELARFGGQQVAEQETGHRHTRAFEEWAAEVARAESRPAVKGKKTGGKRNVKGRATGSRNRQGAADFGWASI